MADLIIVGQGVAGSLLAMEALKQGFSLTVVDSGNAQSASAKAAGLMTPIRGKRLTKLWENDAVFESVITHYRELESRLKSSFLKERILIKQLNDPESLDYYQERLRDAAYKNVLGSEIEGCHYPEVAQAKLTLRIEPVYQLLTVPFLGAVRAFLKNEGLLIEKPFCHADLRFSLEENRVEWDGIKAKHVVFCEGHQGRFNPFFQDVGFQCAKGDLIEVEIERFPENTVFNQGTWLAPLEGSQYRFGTNAIWEFQDEVPNPKTVEPLLKELQSLLKVPFTVKGVQSGIRASFKNRQPLCMRHATHPSLLMINGLGGQGTFWGPLLAKQFFESTL